MKHLFIINPVAGKHDRTEEYTRRIEEVCKIRGLDYAIRVSACKGDCTALARQAAQSGEACRIYACGGDGTLNEIVCGVAGFSNVAVTHYPGGSGNDFVRIFDDPAAFYDLERLLDAEEATFDLIRIGDLGYALNICSLGIDARVAADQCRFKRLPLVTGSSAYNLSLVKNVLCGIRRPYTVTINGKRLTGPMTLVCISNGRFYGGGWLPTPEAMPDDGLLDVLVVKPVSLFKLLRIIGIYKRGGYRKLPEIISHYRVSSLTLESPKDHTVNADGEILSAERIAFSVASEKLRFFYPKGLSYAVKTEANKTNQEQTSASCV